MPNDPIITDMDVYTYNWYYAGWIQNKEDEANKLKDFGTFVGMFSNPELAKKISTAEDHTIEVSDEEFKQSFDYVENMIKEEIAMEGSKKNKKKKKLILKDR